MSPRHLSLLALLLLVPMATAGETAALWLWPGTALGIGLYAFGKVWLAALPGTFHLTLDKQPLSFSPLKHRRAEAILVALALGLAIAGTIVATYAIARHHHLIDVSFFRAKVARNYLDHFPIYLAFALTMSTANALMEEYVWRWFTYTHLARLFGVAEQSKTQNPKSQIAPVLLTALFFTAHHLSALKLYFSWPLASVASAGVIVGSILWSLLYIRYRSIWPGFVSHILADLAIFAVGAHMLFA